MEGANTAYNIPIGLRLRGQLHVEALQRALARIVGHKRCHTAKSPYWIGRLGNGSGMPWLKA